MKTYGTAVLTALQARYKNVEETSDAIQNRSFDAVIRGGSSEEWLACFWKNISCLRGLNSEIHRQ